MAKLVLIFKPDAIIINHQLEFSGTRVKYLDHEKRAYKHEIRSCRKSEKLLILACPERLMCVQEFSEQHFFAFIFICAD